MKTQGVYKIINKINGKVYIGSSKDISKRWCRHKADLRRNIHHSLHLQRAWNKYGEENFIFEIIEVLHNIELKDQFAKEQEYIDYYNACDYEYGYNVQKNAQGCGNSGLTANRSKLTYEQVEEIKIRVISNGENPDKITSEYNVSTDTIRRILNGDTYKEVRPDLTRDKNVKIQYREDGVFDITDNSNKIINLYSEGFSISDIINMGFKGTTVRRNIKKYNEQIN